MPSLLSQVSNVKDIENASRLIFPGVGAIGQAGESITKAGYREALIDYIKVRGWSLVKKDIGYDGVSV